MPTLFHQFIKQFCYPVNSNCSGHHHMYSPSSSHISDWARMREIITILANSKPLLCTQQICIHNNIFRILTDKVR